MFSSSSFQGPKPINTFENIKCIHKNLQECGDNEDKTDLKSISKTQHISNALFSEKKSKIYFSSDLIYIYRA